MNQAEELPQNTTKDTRGQQVNGIDGKQPNGTKPKNSKKKSWGCRLFSIGAVAMGSCLIVCAGIVALAWGTGHLPAQVCSRVIEGSPIHDLANCETYVAAIGADGQADRRGGASGEDAFDVARIFEQANPAVVGVGRRGSQMNAEQVIGSGFAISRDGLIATNQHVVSDSRADYFVRFEGEDDVYDVNEIYRDPINDIAILVVDATDLPALALGDSDDLRPGQEVVAIGNPLGQFSSTVTSGIISGLNREVTVGQSFLRTNVTTFEDTIQTDSAINPGNSGGPLLNSNAEVIGINFATVQGFDNLSFAIPVSYLHNRVEELQEFGRFRLPYVGVNYRNRLVTVGRGVFVGAEIGAVDSEGPAAGVLERGDIIITFNETSLDDATLLALVQRSRIGDEVELGVIRDGETLTLQIEIGENPNL